LCETIHDGLSSLSDISMNLSSENFPLRPAWTEIDLGKLRNNLRLIRRDLPRHVKLLAVVKDEAYGHGALDVARIALEEGAWGFGLSTLEEAMALRDAGIKAPLLLLGERQEAELEWCVAHDLTVCVNEPHSVRKLAKIAADFGKQVPVHVKIHTGMSRYGVAGTKRCRSSKKFSPKNHCCSKA
jgi:alanine racemase